MWGRIAGLVVAVSLAWTGCAIAQEAAAPRGSRYVLSTTPEVVVKMVKTANSKYVRGKLLSLTSYEIVVDTGKMNARDRERGEVGQRIGFDRFESLRTTDGRFEFTVDEDFNAVTSRIGEAYTSVTVEADFAKPKVPEVEPAPEETPPPVVETPKPKKPVENGLGQGGFGGINNLPKVKPNEATTPPEETGTEGTTTPETTPPPVTNPASETNDVLLCSNCMKEIPSSAIKSGVCPHCKIAFSNGAAPSSNPGPNPFAPKPGTNGSATEAFAPTSSAPSVAPAANSGSQVTQTNGFSIDSIPNWAKGGLFVLFVLIGWQLVFNR